MSDEGLALSTSLPGVQAGSGGWAGAPQPGKPASLALTQAGGKSTPGPFVFSLLLTDMDWAAFLLLHLKGLLWD